MVEWMRGRRERLISSWWSLILTAAAAGATLAILTKHNTSFRVALFFCCCCCCSLFSINSIQFNSLCAILRAPVCEYIFMYPFMKMCTQPGLTRQTSQETFARCLSFFSAQRILHLIFVLDFMLCFFLFMSASSAPYSIWSAIIHCSLAGTFERLIPFVWCHFVTRR